MKFPAGSSTGIPSFSTAATHAKNSCSSLPLIQWPLTVLRHGVKCHPTLPVYSSRDGDSLVLLSSVVPCNTQTRHIQCNQNNPAHNTNTNSSLHPSRKTFRTIARCRRSAFVLLVFWLEGKGGRHGGASGVVSHRGNWGEEY